VLQGIQLILQGEGEEMKRKFESKGCTYDVEIFQCGNTDIVRFYEERNEQYGETLTDLVIAAPSYGFLLIQHIAGEAVLTGTLDSKYFHEEMVDDMVAFLENSLPSCRNVYFPYHIDFVAVSSSVEYNGEY